MDLRKILLHDTESGAQVYTLDTLEGTGIGDAEARVDRVPFPVCFVPGTSLAVLGNLGM